MADQIILSVTREQIEQARERLAAAGVDIKGDIGAAKKDGFEVDYCYAADRNELALTLIRKPSIVPASVVKSKLLAAVEPFGIKEKKG